MIGRYEYHSRIDKKSTVGNDATVSATCFEFWDDLKQNISSWNETIKLSVASKDLLNINGKQHRRCPKKAASSAAKDEKPAKR